MSLPRTEDPVASHVVKNKVHDINEVNYDNIAHMYILTHTAVKIMVMKVRVSFL